MQDRELIRMVTFKLQDTAKRLDSLAAEASSEIIRAQLGRVARLLRDQELRLMALPVGDDADAPPAGAAAADRPRAARRAAG